MEIIQIQKEELNDFFKEAIRALKRENQKHIIPASEAMKRLNLKRTAFYSLANSKETLLRRSKTGGYLESSVEAEIERLTK